jgi:glycosyltransferase involved in cell wall biosynthesis
MVKEKSIAKVSAFIIAYHEEELIGRALKSLKGIVDEILVFHDGPCSDKTLKIAKKYTKKVYVLPRKGRAALHLIAAIKKAKHDWVLKLDADEFLSEDLKKNLSRLVSKKNVSAYTFVWPWWDGEKYITHEWPIKKVLFRKSKASFIQFPGWDEPKTKGEIVNTKYLLEHRPNQINSFSSLNSFIEKALGRYGKSQAKYTLEPFDSFEKYGGDNIKDFPITIKLRRKFPLLTAPIFSVAAFFKILFKHNFLKEGKPVILESFKTSIYYLFLGYYVFLLKRGKSLDNAFPKTKKK